MSQFTLDPTQTVLLIIDVQEKIFPEVDRGVEVLNTISKVIKGFQILKIPIVLSEQYPRGLDPTLKHIRGLLGDDYHPMEKVTFSCLDDPHIFEFVKKHPYQQFVVVGIEAHICVLQTVKHLLKEGKEVAVLNDGITSRSIYDFSTSIAEMRDAGARITSAETVLFELVKNSEHPQFKAISDLIKSCPCC